MRIITIGNHLLCLVICNITCRSLPHAQPFGDYEAKDMWGRLMYMYAAHWIKRIHVIMNHR